MTVVTGHQSATAEAILHGMTDEEKSVFTGKRRNCAHGMPADEYIDTAIYFAANPLKWLETSVCGTCGNKSQDVTVDSHDTVGGQTKPLGEIVPGGKYYHATTRENWLEDIHGHGNLYVHVGALFTAMDRLYQENRGKTVYVFEVTVNSGVDIYPKILRDTEDWEPNPKQFLRWMNEDDELYEVFSTEHGAYCYLNDYECPGSFSLYIDAMHVTEAKLLHTIDDWEVAGVSYV